MKPASLHIRPGLLFLAVLLMVIPASASTIFWGSQFNDLLFDSQGNTLDASYSFEIGSFGAFLPTSENLGDWAANWKVFDRAFDPDANGWNVDEQFFTGTVVHNALGGSDSPDADPGDLFPQGEQIYFWVYNSKDPFAFGAEWALVTDNNAVGNSGSAWAFPDPLDPPETSYDIQLADADTAVFGGVNGAQGAGIFGADPGAFSLQTAAVPEPGGWLLLGIAACWPLLRRTRRFQPWA